MSCSVLQELSFELLHKSLGQKWFFFSYGKGWPLEAAKFQRLVSVIKRIFQVSYKTHFIAPKRNPDRAQLVDLTKIQILKWPTDYCAQYKETCVIKQNLDWFWTALFFILLPALSCFILIIILGNQSMWNGFNMYKMPNMFTTTFSLPFELYICNSKRFQTNTFTNTFW